MLALTQETVAQVNPNVNAIFFTYSVIHHFCGHAFQILSKNSQYFMKIAPLIDRYVILTLMMSHIDKCVAPKLLTKCHMQTV